MLTRREVTQSLAFAMTGIVCAAIGEHLDAAASGQQASPREPDGSSAGVETLMKEPLAPMPNAIASVITLTIAPGSNSRPHEHTGPVFAYILKGKIENQVQPDPPHIYRQGEYFYEPPMHEHRMLRNLSETEPAELLIFQVGEKGKPFTIPMK